MSVYGLFLVASSHKKFPSRLRRIEKMRGIACLVSGVTGVFWSNGPIFEVSIVCGMIYIATGVLTYWTH